MPAATQNLTSSQNPFLKDVRRAASKGALTEQGYAVCEGVHLYDEAVRSGIEIGSLLISDDIHIDREWPADVPLYILPRHLFREITTAESPQGVIALIRPRECHIDELFAGNAAALLLDGIQDPGNAGAIVRSSEAFGGTGVVFLKNTVSPFNPKCLRASAGSLFRLPFLNHPAPDAVRASIESQNLRLYAAVQTAARTIEQVDWSTPSAIVIGNEGRGVSEYWSQAAMPVRIPTTDVESLNAAVAAAVILYELRKHRPV